MNNTNEMIKKIMDETTDTEKIKLFHELARYICANADAEGDIKSYIDFYDAMGYVTTHICQFNIGTYKKASFWK